MTQLPLIPSDTPRGCWNCRNFKTAARPTRHTPGASYRGFCPFKNGELHNYMVADRGGDKNVCDIEKWEAQP